MSHGAHPEEDKSRFLNEKEHTKHQLLIGMLVWLVITGRLNLTFVTSSLSRLVAAPREGHLKRLLKVFSYLKKRLVVDFSDPEYF